MVFAFIYIIFLCFYTRFQGRGERKGEGEEEEEGRRRKEEGEKEREREKRKKGKKKKKRKPCERGNVGEEREYKTLTEVRVEESW